MFKVVRPHLVEDERTLAGLREEWAMIERLAHPVILRGFDATLDGPRPHLVLEHLEGPRLSSLVRRYGPLPPEQLIPLGVQLASAVHYLSREGIVHMDIKPSNTIMGAPPRMIDMSVALTVEEAKRLRTQVGTDAYMAPEQADPKELGPVGTAADVWGLGVTLYKAACGELPYSRARRRRRRARRGEVAATGRGADATGGAGPRRRSLDAIMDCLAFDPARSARLPTEVSARLEPALGDLPKPRLGRLKPRL